MVENSSEGDVNSIDLIQSQLVALNEVFRLTGRDLGLTNRQISNWNQEGMFIQPIPENKRKEFDFVESVWVKLAMELSDYGFSFDEIKEYKKILCHSDTLELMDALDSGQITKAEIDSLAVQSFEVEGSNLNFNSLGDPAFYEPMRELRKTNPNVLLNLFSHICFSLLRGSNYRFAFAHGGLMHFDWDYRVEKKKNKSDTDIISSDKPIWNHILGSSGVVVSLDYIISSLALTESQYKKNPRPMNLLLSKTEQEIIERLREYSDCTSFEIRVNNGEPTRITVTKELPFVSMETMIATLIRKNSYGSFKIVYQEGQIQGSIETVSIQLSKSK